MFPAPRIEITSIFELKDYLLKNKDLNKLLKNELEN